MEENNTTLENTQTCDTTHLTCESNNDQESSEYTVCSRCGNKIHKDNAYGHVSFLCCGDCYDKLCEDYIQDYYYKPDLEFYEDLTDVRFIGVELEVQTEKYPHIIAKNVTFIANVLLTNRIYIKSDSSVPSGFEIVSHPMTLRYHMNKMNWEKIFNYLINSGCLSHSAGTCGLHCHVNRSSLGSTYDEQEDTIAKLLYMVEHNWDNFLKFSRRTEEQIQRWASRYGVSLNPKGTLDYAKSAGASRYRCINLQNEDTIEFRIFNGTLRYNTFIATLQMVNEMCNVAVSMSEEDITHMSWSDFISNIDKDKNKELFIYLKERDLLGNTQLSNQLSNNTSLNSHSGCERRAC